MAALDLDVGATLREIGTAIGGYIDDTFEGGQIRSIVVQLDGPDRSQPDDLTGLMVRNRAGDLLAVNNFASLQRMEGANSIRHYDLKRAIRVTAVPVVGVSSGEALQLLKQAGDEVAGQNIDMAFTGLAAKNAGRLVSPGNCSDWG